MSAKYSCLDTFLRHYLLPVLKLKHNLIVNTVIFDTRYNRAYQQQPLITCISLFSVILSYELGPLKLFLAIFNFFGYRLKLLMCNYFVKITIVQLNLYHYWWLRQNLIIVGRYCRTSAIIWCGNGVSVLPLP